MYTMIARVARLIVFLFERCKEISQHMWFLQYVTLITPPRELKLIVTHGDNVSMIGIKSENLKVHTWQLDGLEHFSRKHDDERWPFIFHIKNILRFNTTCEHQRLCLRNHTINDVEGGVSWTFKIKKRLTKMCTQGRCSCAAREMRGRDSETETTRTLENSQPHY